jgi:ABC-type transport system involved in multi-copper enzyme maturation permease subunit
MIGFARLVRSEWTKFRSVRGWLVAVVAAALALVLIGLLDAEGSRLDAVGPGGQARRVLTGPDGEPVQDDLTFVHQPLAGDGSITVRVSAFTGVGSALGPWAKAGVMVKRDAQPGSAYAAVLLTGGHGVRMQYNFTGDVAGGAGPAPATQPRWLRLVRTGATFTGYESADGSSWTQVGSARLTGLPATAEVGMFVTSPPEQTYEEHVGALSGDFTRTRASAVFDNVSVLGQAPAGAWSQDAVSGNPSSVSRSGDTFTLMGSGNIAPNTADSGGAIEHTLVGTFAGLTVLMVLGVLFVTSEYRRGMIRTTFSVTPGRGRVLVAKAVVVGAVGFVCGLVASAVALPLCRTILQKNGVFIFPVGTGTELRLVVGTAAALAAAAVFALAIGTLLRRSAGAVAAAMVLIILPYLLATAGIVPTGPARWLLRLTPAAGFAIQQTVRVYPQVDNPYTPRLGYFPLSPWVGFAVLCGYAVVALGAAVYVVRRRDA